MRRGPIFDLLGVRLVDLEAGCPHCHKRLAEVVEDTTGQWNTGSVVCVDCGLEVRLPAPAARIRLVPALRSRGQTVAVCTGCRWAWLPTTRANAARRGEEHLLEHHPEVAA